MKRTKLRLTLIGTKKILLSSKATGEAIGTIEKYKSSANSKNIKLVFNFPESVRISRVPKAEKI